jgi:DNA gyrase inhibitor GyrI
VQELGLRQTVDLRESIRRMIAWRQMKTVLAPCALGTATNNNKITETKNFDRIYRIENKTKKEHHSLVCDTVF